MEPSAPLIRRKAHVIGFIKENNLFRLLHAWFTSVHCTGPAQEAPGPLGLDGPASVSWLSTSQ